ncbi:hydrogenase maturation nickel metallochaperone HypA [Dactylosporangium matsuzakiense]|uniref:Hydrogenase maturation factor HypA n=1 Tax=Dactylosporangium matsuzakiense TaxID=53360 RepID=A0A9W6KMA0_9ACTN|nr:hydrogenase maturation nickel metallochaperone HypA [Dactylosporangium matsuzakiense]GLL04636.1 hypothetical protein GCM10017581_063830 [Dactylosporangium matsuzakiense]
MHELSICEAIALAVLRHAGGRRVRSIQLQVGELRQVVPDTLVFCWSVAVRDPLLEGALLDIDVVPASVECVECGVTSRMDQFALQCRSCQGPVSVVSGEELLVVSIEVVDADDVVDADLVGGSPNTKAVSRGSHAPA